MSTRAFSIDDQRAFARLSGDFNPMHVDPVAARRLIFGDVVVHGVHGLLWAMDACFEQLTGPCSLRSARARFSGPILVGEEVAVRMEIQSLGAAALEILAGDQVRTSASFDFSPVTDQALAAAHVPEELSEAEACCDLTFEQASVSRGQVRLALDRKELSGTFPNLAARLPEIQAAQLLATTRLVGMHCPGLHSLFNGLELRFEAASQPLPELAYEVTRADARTGKILLRVQSPGMIGTLTTFLRPRPVAQAAMADVATRMEPGEFAGQRALIVGGTRGLGEAAAKILATGGASVRLTYHQGRSDAERVVSEIEEAGGEARAFCLDVTARPIELEESLAGWTPTHLYYFATPRIPRSRPDAFSPTLFNMLCRYYVEGFYETAKAVRLLTAEPLAVIYPSTVFLDAPAAEFGEYAAAKAAGEALCAHLQRMLPDVSVCCPRLPRVRTDQVAGLLPVSAADPVEVMLATLRSINSPVEVRA